MEFADDELMFSRFSVVDSMLSSLSNSQHDLHTHDIYSAQPGLAAATHRQAPAASNTGRRRGHTQSSSMSDYDASAHVDDVARSYSEYHARGRHGSKNHTRPLTGIKTASNANGTDPFKHTRGGVTRGSRGSGSSSVDLGYKSSVMTSRAIPHRAASFDHGYSPQKNFSHAPGKDSPVPLDYTAFDAAPTPTVPAGPRRPSEPVSPLVGPMSPNPAKQRSAPSRRNSIKSTAGKSLKKSKSSAPVSSDIRDQAKQFVQYTSNARNTAHPMPVPLPPHQQQQQASGAAPSPTVATIRKTQPAAPAPPPKEQKPGFFRRVFGSSKHEKQPTHHDEVHRPPSPAAVRKASLDANNTRPRTQPSQQNPNMQFKTTSSAAAASAMSSRPPTQDASGSSGYARDQAPPLPLRKAHSSFFRRRKKSISDNAPPPPVPPLDLPLHKSVAALNIAPTQNSPGASSLRAAMTPYLDQTASPQDMFFDSREQQSESPAATYAGFSASIPDGLRRTSSRQGTHTSLVRAVTADKPSSRTVQPNVTGNFENGSFLVDTSSNEAMDSSSPIDPADDLGIITTKRSNSNSQVTSDPFWNQNKGKTGGSGVGGPTTRKANIGEKRAELSPISDRSQQQHEHVDRAHFLRDNAADADADDGDDDDDDEGIVISVKRRESVQKNANKTRMWLDASSSDEKLVDSLRLQLPLEGPKATEHRRPSLSNEQGSPSSEGEVYMSASSLPALQVGDREMRMSREYIDVETAKAIMADDLLQITQSDRDRARAVFDGDEEFVSKAGAAAWLGQTTPLSTRTRKAYMELFDWQGMNILAAFRELCGRLVVKAESQQLDRVIEAFSSRWCECNPNHGFKDPDVVHTITFSILMLNTDLHIADIDQRMTRSQFVKNTLPTIRSIADAAAPGATDTVRAKGKNARDQMLLDRSDAPEPESSAQLQPPPPKRRPSLDLKRNRLSIRPPARSDSYDESGSSDGCNILVKAPCAGSMKDWETQIEIVLREFYNSIRQQRLPLHGHGASPANLSASENSQQTGLTVSGNGLRRTPSVLSKAPSENASYRGRSGEHSRFNTARFASKNRSRPRVYPNSTVGSSRTSLDDNSVWSPAASTWSKYSLSKTQTSTMSVESFGSHFAQPDYQKAIGFANALSQAIIREEGMNGPPIPDDLSGRVVPLLDDDTLELIGPPWAKEGIVKHKHHLESLDKKAKDRNWVECFAVIEKGWIKLFSFTSRNKNTRQRAKSRSAGAGGPALVGGGNWTENAELLSEFLLRQTIASALPFPGYSKNRPHVFALSLPTGAVHLFQVGTAEIVKEFVTTANYWSARLSKPPLVGGVSNIEYGWGDSVLNPALMLQRPESATPGQTPGTSSSNHSGLVGRTSMNAAPSSPVRRSDDVASVGYRMRLPGDKVVISDWSPPTQSMMASQLMEVDQLRELSTYVANVEDELTKHNELRPLMGMAFSPRHPNAAKAMANWEKKSAYLLREIVKFKTYVDSLKAAQQQKEVVLAEREARAAEKTAREGDDAEDAANQQKQQEEASTTAADDAESSPNTTTNTPVPALPFAAPPVPPKTAQST
ncbi:uncharacterized protein PV09_05974 [Verruconis gallopava]|uniref:SEC7 domain-containing protein n=1 Tax=Verruconis gallopava TaxID=253628 RepID=A0A0D2A849_9PEZI|nr:uncharacterized protein PV09_05974 [Verruconis gallopava]KIW02928.1 hypothetical protein PV09_05974 [Verruconis gallopava]